VRAPREENWVGGWWVPARSGQVFELSSRRESGAVLGEWPRSSRADVRDALTACTEAAAAWRARSRKERRGVLSRVPDELERAPGLAQAIADSLGLEPGELAARLEEDLFRFREALEILAEGEPAGGVGLFQAHWSDLAGGLGARLGSSLLAGRTALVISDPRLPAAAQAVARALEVAGLPEGVIALLHDDTGESLEAALGAELDWVRLKGTEERLRRLESWLPPGSPVTLSRYPVRNRTHVVRRAADPAEEAERVVEQAFGRSCTLSGQFPGQIGRVLCHQRLFSRFSEELLARLERSPDVRAPAPLIEEDLLEHLQGAWALGLDEGATPIFGGEPPRSGPGMASAERGAPGAGGRRAARPPRALQPVVYTNVEAFHRLARLSRPAPLLGLMRAPSDETAAEQAAELDGLKGAAAGARGS
jgi:acyl-CoA reductase-like NAD-dependent aldehyde dehydrogenase